MKIRSALLACAFAGVLGSTEILAQNAYITNNDDADVSVIDTKFDKVIATIPIGGNPYGVAVSPDGRKAYTTNGINVAVIDTAMNAVIAMIPITGATADGGIAVTPDSSKVYSGSTAGVAVIDAATNAVTAIIPIGPPIGLAVTPDGSKVYVTVPTAHAVMVIDTVTNAVSFINAFFDAPVGIAVTPDGKTAYVANLADASVAVIDTATNTVAATINVGNAPEGVTIAPDGGRVYVTNSGFPEIGIGGVPNPPPGPGGNSVSVIATATNSVVATIPVGQSPLGVVVTPDGERLLVADTLSNDVSVIDTATNAVVSTIAVGRLPAAFGNFIQPTPASPKFAGTPGKANCHGKSVSALTQQYGGLNNAAAALGYRSVSALQNAVMAFCEA
jgi:YVTN family beta-propeller protein